MKYRFMTIQTCISYLNAGYLANLKVLLFYKILHLPRSNAPALERIFRHSSVDDTGTLERPSMNSHVEHGNNPFQGNILY